MSLPVSYAFSEAFSDASGLIKIGYPQAFRRDRGSLFLLVYVEVEESNEVLDSEMEWVNAAACVCVDIIDIFILQELMSRDEVTLKDLERIKDFKTKYTEEVS